jgi:hypothetical protein
MKTVVISSVVVSTGLGPGASSITSSTSSGSGGMRNVEETRPLLGVVLAEVAENLDIRSARVFSIAPPARNFPNTGLRDMTLLSSSQADRVIDY